MPAPDLLQVKKGGMVLLLLLILGSLVFAPAAGADGPIPLPPHPHPTPEPSGTPVPGDDEDGGNIIHRIVNHIIEFSTENLIEAVNGMFRAMLEGALDAVLSPFQQALENWFLRAPSFDSDDFHTPWAALRTVAIAIWPLTLGILMAVAAKHTTVGSAWGLEDAKTNLANWIASCLLTVFSLPVLSFFNRFSNSAMHTIIEQGGGLGMNAHEVANVMLSPVWIVLGIAPGGKIGFTIISIFAFAIGIAVLVGLVIQFVARYAMLVLLVALAPLVITLAVLPPLRWLQGLWLKGIVLMELLGPINAILLVLVGRIGGAAGEGFGAAVLHFLIALAYLSLIITVNSTVIKGVFGGVMEVMQKTTGALAAVGTLALAGAGFISGAGALASAGAPGPGTPGPGGLAAGVGGTGGIGGGSTGASRTDAGRGSEGRRPPLSTASSSRGADTMRSWLNRASTGQGLKRAGSVLQAGFGSGAMRAAGSLMSQMGKQLSPTDIPPHQGQEEEGEEDIQIQGQWEDMLSRVGISPQTREGRRIKGALNTLAGRYRNKSFPVTEAAREALGPVASAHQAGLSLQDMAKSQGYQTGRDFLDGTVEAHLAVPPEERLFRRSGKTQNPVGLAYPDFAAAGRLAAGLGLPTGPENAQNIAPYAALHSYARNRELLAGGMPRETNTNVGPPKALFDTQRYARRQVAGAAGFSQLPPTQAEMAQGIFARNIPAALGLSPSEMPEEFRPLIDRYAPVRSMPGLDGPSVMQGQNIAAALGVELSPQAVRPYAELYQAAGQAEGSEAAYKLVEAAWSTRRDMAAGGELTSQQAQKVQRAFAQHAGSVMMKRGTTGRPGTPLARDRWEKLLAALTG